MLNKDQIASIALEVAREMRCEFPADEWDNSGEEHSEESYTFYKSELIEFATRFLAAVDAERAKEGAVAWIHATDSRAVLRSIGGLMDTSQWLPTFLNPAPAIPEGWKLVPPDAIEALETIKYVATNMGLKTDGMKSIYDFATYIQDRMLAEAPKQEVPNAE